MFEAAELDNRIDKETYAREEPQLREALLGAQVALAECATFPVIIVIGGVDGAGKGETVNLLNEWMDPRHIRTHAFPEPSDEERERPRMWRYWRALPPRGTIGILFGAWHTEPILSRVMRETRAAAFNRAIAETVRFEQMLADEGVLLLKFWFHLSKERQEKRLKALERDPLTRWRVTGTDWERFKLYDRFRDVSGKYLRQTSTNTAPWIVVDGNDARYRSLMVGQTLLAALQGRLDRQEAPLAPDAPTPAPPPSGRTGALDGLDLSKHLAKDRYDERLEALQGKLNRLSRDPKFKRLSVITLFEGQDASGKGGAIRRITGALDARQYQGIPIAAPTEDERAQPYLWRFWRHLPRHGRFTIFDRSWYGRVLVERVEGFCLESDWRRAYTEINDFEEQLAENGCVLVKFWLQVSKEEQLRRFLERQEIGFKRFKITAEDWRNREKWEGYEVAAEEMIARTSTALAPWTLVEAEDKYFARIKVLKTLTRRIERALDEVK